MIREVSNVWFVPKIENMADVISQSILVQSLPISHSRTSRRPHNKGKKLTYGE